MLRVSYLLLKITLMEYIVYVFFKHFILQSIIFNTLIYIQYIFKQSYCTFIHDISGSGHGQYKVHPVFWFATWVKKMDPSCLLGIACFDPMKEKITCCRHFKLIVFLDNFGHRIAKSGERGPKQLLRAYCALKTFGFFLHLLK